MPATATATATAAATAAPLPAGALPWSLAGEAVWLLPEGALWWPAGAALFVADLHLGKAATFRARGLPVPGGTTQHNLARLSQLVQQHRAGQLVLLGDFLHAAQAQSAALQAARSCGKSSSCCSTSRSAWRSSRLSGSYWRNTSKYSWAEACSWRALRCSPGRL